MAEAGASPAEIAVAMKAAFAAAGKADDPFIAEELAISMAKALAASGASPDDIGRDILFLVLRMEPVLSSTSFETPALFSC